MQRRATIRDIAEAAGVTHGTVSRALRGDARVKPETLRRVKRIAAELDYRPNLAARHFQRGATGNIGILCDSGPWMIYSHYFGKLIAGVVQASQDGGYRSALYLPSGVPDGMEAATPQRVRLRGLEELLDGRIDAGILVGSRRQGRDGLQAVEQAGLPLVLLGNDLPVPGHFELRSGAAERVRLATLHMLKRHRRAPALLGLYRGSAYNQAALLAWSGALSEAGLPPGPFIEAEGGAIVSEALLLEAARKAIAAGAGSLICSDLSQAMQCFELVRSGRLKRPEGFELCTFGPLLVDRITALPAWVRFFTADLMAEGARAFQLAQRALKKRPVEAWVMRWSLGDGQKA
jgi:DNA-binding LacI/PurR family transcriptional regulator